MYEISFFKVILCRQHMWVHSRLHTVHTAIRHYWHISLPLNRTTRHLDWSPYVGLLQVLYPYIGTLTSYDCDEQRPTSLNTLSSSFHLDIRSGQGALDKRCEKERDRRHKGPRGLEDPPTAQKTPFGILLHKGKQRLLLGDQPMVYRR